MPGPGMILTDENVLLTEILYLALVMQNYIKYIYSYNGEVQIRQRVPVFFLQSLHPKLSLATCL